MADLLLPPNATPLELAFEKTSAERYPLDTDIIRRAGDPWAAPVHLLPFLAYDRSVDVWNDNWPETRKRRAIANAPLLHSRKGTLWALREAARLADAELIRATLPPSKVFCAPSLTADEREAFMSRYPELRIYRYRGGSTAGRATFAHRFFASDAGADHGMRAARFPTISTAAGRLGRQAYFYQDGVETPMSTATRYTETVDGLGVDYDEVRRGGHGIGAFAGYAAGSRCAYDHHAAKRIYRVRAEARYSALKDRVHFNTVKPGLDPLGYDSQPVSVRGQRRGIFSGGGGGYVGGLPVPTDANDRLYDRLWLFDPAVPIESRGRSTHLGGARLGMPAYNAEIVLRMRGRRPLFMTGRFVFGQVTATDHAPYHEALAAVSAARSMRDRILIQTTTVKPVTAGLSVIAGDYIAGEIQEII